MTGEIEREVIRLRTEEHMTIPEIAKEVGWGEVAVSHILVTNDVPPPPGMPVCTTRRPPTWLPWRDDELAAIAPATARADAIRLYRTIIGPAGKRSDVAIATAFARRQERERKAMAAARQLTSTDEDFEMLMTKNRRLLDRLTR